MLWRTGERVGQYEIISELGRGGMATVYKAYHAQLDRNVAIKVMHQTYIDDNNFIERFKREAQIVARLEHPHIVPVYDFSEYQGMPYIVMKFIQGRTLKERLFKKVLSLDEIIHIMQAVCSAATYAHKKGVLHRDIKPSNIVIDQDNVPFLADFGLARIAQAGESTMSADVLLGTPNYMSPEQAKGVKDLNSRSDIYSLGVVLYELLVGQVPFTANTPLAVIHDHIYKPLPLPSLINPEISLALEEVMVKALAKNPQDRYETADEMIQAVKRVIHAEGITELDENRANIADESLSRIRAEYVEADDGIDDNDSIAQSVRNLAAPSPPRRVQHSPEPEAILIPQAPVSESATPIEPKYQTATIYQREPYARQWIIAGTAIFGICAFFVIGVLLNATNTFLEIAEVSQRLEIRAEINFDDEASIATYDLPDLTVEEALSAIDEDPEDVRNYLVLATQLYNAGETDQARTALAQGKPHADDQIRYLSAAVSIANNAKDKNATLAYGVLLYDLSSSRADDRETLANNTVGEYLYEQSNQPTQLDLLRNNARQLLDYVADEDKRAITESAIMPVIVTHNLVASGRNRLADLSLPMWKEESRRLPFGKLVLAKYELASGNVEFANSQLKDLVEASNTPEWIVTIADELLNTIEDR